MIAKIHITFKDGVLDPQGKAVHRTLIDLGYNEVSEIQMGKYLELKMDGVSREEAENRMINAAIEKGADAIINMRFMTSSVPPQAAEILAYGTAVKLK